MSEKAVTTPEIDDAPAATYTSYASRGFPGFEQLFARQATGMADGAGQSMKQRVVGKAPEIVIGQPILRGRIEQHAPSIEQRTRATQWCDLPFSTRRTNRSALMFRAGRSFFGIPERQFRFP